MAHNTTAGKRIDDANNAQIKRELKKKGYAKTTSGKYVKIKKLGKTSPGTSDSYWYKAKRGFKVKDAMSMSMKDIDADLKKNPRLGMDQTEQRSYDKKNEAKNRSDTRTLRRKNRKPKKGRMGKSQSYSKEELKSFRARRKGMGEKSYKKAMPKTPSSAPKSGARRAGINAAKKIDKARTGVSQIKGKYLGAKAALKATLKGKTLMRAGRISSKLLGVKVAGGLALAGIAAKAYKAYKKDKK